MTYYKTVLIVFSISFSIPLNLLAQSFTKTIISGVHWYDQHQNTVSAHGAGVLKEGTTFYLFGEFKRDDSNAFNGFSCYSSKNLSEWKFENVVLPVQSEGRLSKDKVGERPKVLKNPKTGEYIMFMHTDDLNYKDPVVSYATSNTIDGTYQFQGPLLFDGKPIKRWDMGVFQDSDGQGYLVMHHGDLYRLSADYKSIMQQITTQATKCESPVIFRKNGIYFWLGSGLTGWERNDNFYYTAKSLEGPWEYQGTFAPKGTLTYNSQSTFVLPIQGSKDTTYVYMGDRWSHPKQNASATYVWQPLQIHEKRLTIPEFYQNWSISIQTGEWEKACFTGKIIENNDPEINYEGSWEHHTQDEDFSDSYANEKGDKLTYTFEGSQIGMVGVASSDKGYAQVTIQNAKGKEILSNVIDMYCKYPEASLKFLSPKFPKGTYTISISVLGEHWFWTEKSGKKSGSSDVSVSLDKFIIN